MTTVFCAVWSGDPHRHELARAHRRCLDAQTRPVLALYVFDAGDPPPSDLDGIHVVVDEPLTIYQAWSLATQAATTPYVMNLNLDDRLYPDAVATLEDTLLARGADLVGGDWRVTYDRDATDRTGPTVPAAELPFDPAWPPRPGTTTRLGSGTGERGTYGPAVLWRRDLHERAPYPWRFGNGEVIRSIGDAVWWSIVEQMGGRLVRLPTVIGNYHSHPTEQAEFRLPAEQQHLSSGVDLVDYRLTNTSVSR